MLREPHHYSKVFLKQEYNSFVSLFQPRQKPNLKYLRPVTSCILYSVTHVHPHPVSVYTTSHLSIFVYYVLFCMKC